MDMNEIKTEIVNRINSTQGCKLVELIPSLSKEVILSCSHDDLMLAIDELVAAEEIRAIEYVLRDLPYRVKTFLLPPCESIEIVPSAKLK